MVRDRIFVSRADGSERTAIAGVRMPTVARTGPKLHKSSSYVQNPRRADLSTS
jgi:hypothetical protein